MNQRYLLAAALCGAAAVASAVDVVMDNSDGPGKSSFNSSENWANDLPPGPGTNYFINGKTMRTPEAGDSVNSNHVFAGASLTLNGGTLAWKSRGALTIDNLIADGGTLGHWNDHTLARLYGNTWINAGRNWRIDATGNNRRDFDIHSRISGPGNLLVVMGLTADKASKLTMLYNADNDFTGRTIFERDGQLGFTDEGALGPNPPSYVFNQLSIYGGWIWLTNSVTIDDPNRGINLRTNTQYDLNGGGFEVGAGATATVSCLINGAGSLAKRGAGRLVLATNETYTGNTYVFAGELNIAPGASIVSTGIVVEGSSALFSGQGSFDTLTLRSGGSLRGVGAAGVTLEHLVSDGGALAVDPAADDPSAPRVTVTGSIVKDAFTPIMVNVLSLDTVQREFKVLEADALAAFGPQDFCVHPPWAGFLSVEDNGSGGRVLTLKTQPGDAVVYLTSIDSINTSAFFKTNWSDNLPPAAGKIHVNNAYEMRTPPSGIHTFAGDRLVFDGRNLSMKGGTQDMTTINDLVMMNNASMSLAQQPVGQLWGNVTLHPILDPGRDFALNIYGWTPLRSFHMFANLHGYGELRMFSGGDPAFGDATFTLRAMNTNFFGRIRLSGDTNFTVRVTCEENLGGAPLAFRADQMIFNGGGLSVTNDVVIDDPGRGFTLLADGGVSGTSPDAGGYAPGTPVADRTFGGGAVFAADAGSTLTINSPITGPGDILKHGAGSVVLGGGNSYTGLTEIVQGALAGSTADAFGTGPVSVKGEGRLLTLYSEAMPANGVELGGMIEFVNGGGVRIEPADGAVQPAGNFSVPLFLLPEGGSLALDGVSVEHSMTNVGATLTTSTVGTRTLVSASFTSFAGTMIIIR
jgi:fibronectin-binding autotransporter adhesin